MRERVLYFISLAYAGHTPMRPPTSYPDGTPRSPRYEDNEEEAVYVSFFFRALILSFY